MGARRRHRPLRPRYRDVPHHEGKPCSPDCHPGCSCGAYLEIWNDVFMEYNKKADGTYEPLPQKNVDTGMGLERTIAVLQGVSSVYETDIYQHIISTVEEICGKKTTQGEEIKKAIRIVADHLRCATFIMGDERGVSPSNVDQGYVLRRLIRRAVRFGRKLDLPAERLTDVAQAVIDTYQEVYPELVQNRTFIMDQLRQEVKRFSRTLEQGVREFERVAKKAQDGAIDGVTAFHLYDTYGFPIEITQEMAQRGGSHGGYPGL